MRYRNKVTGVVVSVRDDKELGAEWEPADGSKRRRRSTPAPEPSTSTPAPPTLPDPPAPADTFVVSDHSIADVLAFVGDDVERAAEVLKAEADGKNRPSLVKKLEAITAAGD